jgi:hypothetical protein
MLSSGAEAPAAARRRCRATKKGSTKAAASMRQSCVFTALWRVVDRLSNELQAEPPQNIHAADMRVQPGRPLKGRACGLFEEALDFSPV